MKTALSIVLIGLITLVSLPQRAAADPGPAKQSETSRSLPFHGKLVAVDPAAGTITVGKRIFHITADTKILKDNQPVPLSESLVGQSVGGAYLKTEDGSLRALSIRIGDRSDKENKDKKSPENDSSV